MKLTPIAKDISSAPKDCTRVLLVEKGSERCIEKDGVSELHIVVGAFKKITPRTFRTIVRTVVQSGKKYKLKKLAVQFDQALFPQLCDQSESWFFSTISENLQLAAYEFTVYKSTQPTYVLREIILGGVATDAAKRGVLRGSTVATAQNAARDLANTPGGDMTPTHLGIEAKRLLKGTKATVRVLGLSEIQKLKMGALIGVGKGAKDKPVFIVIEYWGLGKAKKTLGTKGKQGSQNNHEHDPIVFVGKGVTFDTGGLQVKPGMAMYEMHMDMSGGASVIAAIQAIAKLGLKKNVIGLIPAAENAVSGEAIRPGDVLVSMSGKTIDVLHTDAEGRLILADALHYAKRYNPRLVIDVATLTGAALSALGEHAHAVMTKSRALEDTLRELGEQSGDYVWPLPLWDEYKQYTKGVHGDISNIPANDSKYGGAINGGMFLSHFTEGLTWAHIDMAPRMTSTQSDKLAKGATGEPTRLLVTIAEQL